MVDRNAGPPASLAWAEQMTAEYVNEKGESDSEAHRRVLENHKEEDVAGRKTLKARAIKRNLLLSY